MKYHEMTKNYIFREFECGMSKEYTAKLCFRSVRQITEWDKGSSIPPECKRLMRMVKGRELSISPEWEGFIMHANRLELPNGKLVSPQEIIAGIALLEINSELEITTSTKIIKYARLIAKTKGN